MKANALKLAGKKPKQSFTKYPYNKSFWRKSMVRLNQSLPRIQIITWILKTLKFKSSGNGQSVSHTQNMVQNLEDNGFKN
jgi:hypothetical protein